MSKTVDERVVSMQFDNRQFESNVKTSMSTLDKLKQSLNFKDSAKGLESINAAAKNTNLSGLSAGIETVRTKFSAMQVMGITALTNITNTAVNAGKRMVSALTIDPIKTGFDEYETKINSIQTIMSNTASKGTTMKDVTRVIDDLNTYADKTIYNFAEMTRNIGTFTAAGVGLEKSASAIKGIANLAAASGSNSQQASTAMYQLSQALAAGTVKLQDWNSVVNAGMGGEKFQEALKATAREHGVAIDKIIKKQGSFRESLKTGWMTADILNETLNKFTVDGAKKYAKSMVESGKWTKKQADALVKEAQSMEDAATKVKTFTQLWDTLKEAAQSGWGKTWELIIGDFDQAKDLFTKLSKFFGGMIDRMSDARNAVLQSALGKGFKGLSKSLDTVIEPAKKATKAVSDLGNIVDKVIGGDFGNGKDRFDALTKAGQNYYRVQNKVNETLGNSHRYTAKQIAEQDKLIKGTDKEINGTTKLTKEKKNLLKEMASMTEEQMHSKGYTDEQINAFKELGKTADKLGMPLNKFIDNMDKINGRWLLLKGFENIGKSILSVFKTIGTAWKEVFPPKSTKEKANNLFNLIAAFHKFSTTLKMNDKTADKLRRTFKGLFAILDLVSKVVGGTFKIAFKVITSILDIFGLDILDVTAFIGDAVVGFRDWANSALDFGKVISKVIPYLKSFGKSIGDWFAGIKEADNIPVYIISGLVNGLKNGAKSVIQGVIELGKNILEGIKGVLGIHSPSVEFFEIGKNIIAGLINGIQNGASTVWNVIKTIGTKAIEAIQSINWNAVFAGLISLGMVATIKRIADAIDSLVSPLQGLGNVLSGAGKVLDESAKGIGKSFMGLSKVLKSFAFSIKAKAIKNIAISIAILVGCVVALALMDSSKVWGAIAMLSALIGVFTAMIAIVEVLSMMSSKLGTGAINFGALSVSILGIGAAMLLMGITLKIIGSMNPDQYKQSVDGMVGVVSSLIALVATYGLLVKGKAAKNSEKLGKMLRKMAVAMLLMAVVMKILGSMNTESLIKGFAALAGFVGVIALLTLITKLAGKSFDTLGNTLMKMSVAMLLMAVIVKTLGGMDPSVLTQGLVAVGIFVIIVGVLTVIAVLGSNSFGNLGKTLMSMSVSMLLMTAVVRILGGMDPAEMAKGYLAILGFVGIIALLTLVVKMLKKDAPKMAVTILAMSASIAILAGIAILLSLIDLAGLAKGVIAVGILGSVIALMIHATKDAKNCKGNLIVMTVAIGIMAAAVAALSMIDPTRLAGAVIALSIVMGMFALMTKAASNVKSAIGPLIVMVVAVGLIGGVLYLLSGLPVQGVLSSAAALSVLLIAMSVSLKLISKVGPTALLAVVSLTAMTVVVALLGLVLAMMSALNTQSAITNVLAISILLGVMTVALLLLQFVGPTALLGVVSLAALTLVVAGLGLVLAMMSALDTKNAIVNVTALSILLGVMTVALLLLQFVGPTALLGVVALGALTIVVALLGLVLAMMSALDTQNAIVNATALSILLGVMTAALLLLQFVGPTALLGIVSLGALTIVIGLLGLVLAMMSKLDTQNAIVNATALSILLVSMSAALVVLAGVGLMGPAALIGVASLAAMIVAIGALIIGIGALVQKFPQLESFLDTGIPILEKIGHAIGSFFGNIVSGFIDGATSTLPKLGETLSQFMLNLTPFIVGAKMIDSSVIDNVKSLAGVIMIITGASLLEAITSFLTGGSSISGFAEELVPLGTGLKQFSDSVAGINTENVTAAANAAKALAQMADTIPNEGGMVAWFTGENSMSKFAGELPALGGALKKFSDSVSGVNAKNLTAAANAGKAIAEMCSTIPNEGGVAAWFAGENSITSFANELPKLGTGLLAFSAASMGIDVKSVKAAAEAGKAITDMCSTIPAEGGVAAWFAGESSIANFADSLPKLAKGLFDFSVYATGLDIDSVNAATNAAKSIAEMASVIPAEGGIAAWFTGESSITNFADDLPVLGNGLKKFSDSLKGMNAENVRAAAEAGKSIAAMTNAAPEDPSNLLAFGDSLGTFGSKLKVYFDNISGITGNAVTASTNAVKSIVDATKNVDLSKMKEASSTIDGLVNSLKSAGSLSSETTMGFTTALKGIGDAGVNSLINAFKNAEPNIQKAGSGAVNKLTTGAKSKSNEVKKAFQKVVTDGTKKISTDEYKKVGENVVKGFAEGIKENTWRAKDKAKAMAKSAKTAAMKELDEHSPSKEFYKIGDFAGLGFVNALGTYEKKSYKVSAEVAKSAKKGLSKSISNLASIVDTDIDSQPTIRPVLDLSDISNGAGAINGMFDMQPSVGVMSDVRSVSAMMNSRQNGNAELLSAVKGLRKDIANSNGGVSVDVHLDYNAGSDANEIATDIATSLRRAIRRGV